MPHRREWRQAMAVDAAGVRRPLVAGNWKMNLTHTEGARLAAAVTTAVPPGPVEVVLCPPFTALPAVAAALEAGGAGPAGAAGPVALGAQDLHWEERGAFTGEV